MAGRDVALGRIQHRQLGVFSGKHAVDTGFPRRTIQDRVSRDVWNRLVGDTYAPTGTPTSPFQLTLAASPAAGTRAAVSHLSAAAWWQLGIHVPEVPTVTVPAGRKLQIDGMRTKRTRRWSRTEVVRSGSIHVTSPRRTLLDCTPLLDDQTLGIALDTSHRRGSIHLAPTIAYLESAVAAKVRGASRLLALVRMRDPNRPSESPAETVLYEVLRRYGVPLPERQVWVDTRNGRRRIDHAYPNERIAIEVVGYEWHDGRVAFDDDEIRDSELADLGWERRYVTWTLLDEGPAEAAWTVARALGLEPVRWRRP